MSEKTPNFFRKILKRVLTICNKGLNLVVAVLLLLMFSYGLYSLIDNERVLATADATAYETYKPVKKNDPTFAELTAQNSDVFSWLNVYGTQIDYPVVQGKNNNEYLNSDVYKNYKMSGSLFLDSANQRDYSDLNSIIYGHHMEKSAMFGDLDKFLNENYFMEHQFGNLYFNGENHGLAFFAFMVADAYDETIYATPIKEEENKVAYINNLKNKAKWYRETSVTTADHLLLLSTCSSDATNGRYILVGKVVEQQIAIPKAFQAEVRRHNSQLTVKAASFLSSLNYTSKKAFLIFILVFFLLLTWYISLVRRRKSQEKGGCHAPDEK